MNHLALAELTLLSENYGIDPVHQTDINMQGITNLTFEFDESFFLTIYKRRTSEELEAVAEAANLLDPQIPIVRPLRGRTGFVTEMQAGPALLTKKVAGKHYVGINQMDKQPVPESLHRSLAECYWMLQRGLSALPDDLKDRLMPPGEAGTAIPHEKLPDFAQHLAEYAPSNYDQMRLPTYPDLVHDDMERQNILSIGNKITGIVDLDSIMKGDVLYQFGHFVFNLAFCDPNAGVKTAAPYFKAAERAGYIKPEDMAAVQTHIHRFVANDLAEIAEISAMTNLQDERTIDLPQLSMQYERALIMAGKFFNEYYPSD